MTAQFDTLEFTKRLESAGLARKAAEAISSGMAEATRQTITVDMLDARLEIALARQDSRLMARFGLMMAGGLTLATAVLGVLISIQ